MNQELMHSSRVKKCAPGKVEKSFRKRFLGRFFSVPQRGFFLGLSIYFSSRTFKVFEIYISVVKMKIHSFEKDYKEVWVSAQNTEQRKIRCKGHVRGSPKWESLWNTTVSVMPPGKLFFLESVYFEILSWRSVSIYLSPGFITRHLDGKKERCWDHMTPCQLPNSNLGLDTDGL